MDNTNNGNNKTGLILAVILFLLVLGLGWYAWTLNSTNTDLASQNNLLRNELNDLESLKSQLETEVDSLQLAFEGLAEENALLEGTIQDAEQEIQNQKQVTRKFRKEAEAATMENMGLRSEIQSLIQAKDELQLRIGT